MILVDSGAWRDFHAYRWKNQHPFSNLLLA